MLSTKYDMTRDECRKCLRCLELDAYGTMVSVLRAQGPFTNEKKQLLQELAKILHISNERHRAEVRRAVSDEKLAMIAEQLNGPNTGTDWAIEGRRTIPLLSRLRSRTAYTTLANSLSLTTASANTKQVSGEQTLDRTKDISAKVEVKSIPEHSSNENSLVGRKRSRHESKVDENLSDGNTEIEESASTNNKSHSPLPKSPPVKVLVMSPGSLEKFNHNNAQELFVENNDSTEQSDITVIPIDSDCDGSESTVNSHTEAKVNRSVTNSSIESGLTARVTQITAKGAENLISPIIEKNPHYELENEEKCDNTRKRIVSLPYNSLKIVKSDSVQSNSLKRVRSSVNSGISLSPVESKLTTNVNRIVNVCPKMMSLESNEQISTVVTKNIPHNLNTKLTSKNNIILIQKGSSIGVTLSHAGKEMLGKVISGKSVCIKNQQKINSINLVSHSPVMINNGDWLTTTSSSSLSHNDSLDSNVKSGTTIVSNPRQTALERHSIIPLVVESSNSVLSELKTVISTPSTNEQTETSNNDVQEEYLPTDTVVNSIVDEKLHRSV